MTIKAPPAVTDHAILRYLERAHGLDTMVVRRYLSGRATNAARLGAIGVTIDGVKLVLRDHTVVTALKGSWHTTDGHHE